MEKHLLIEVSGNRFALRDLGVPGSEGEVSKVASRLASPWVEWRFTSYVACYASNYARNARALPRRLSLSLKVRFSLKLSRSLLTTTSLSYLSEPQCRLLRNSM